MHLLRFLALLFVFIGLLASCAVAITLLALALRFWPILLVFALGISLLGCLFQRVGIRITSQH